jgi:microcystin-dependent protein
MGMGDGPGLSPHLIGEKGGSESVTLSGPQIPIHQHEMMGSSDTQSTGAVANNSLGTAPRGATQGNVYVPGATNPVRMGISTSPIGGNQPHSNMQPYQAINYCIAYDGIFPSGD